MAAKRKPKAEAKPAEPTPEELAKLTRVEAPMIYASAFVIQASGNDFHLVLQRGGPAQDEHGNLQRTVGKLDVVGVVTMSPQSLKDLWLVIDGQIKKHEEAFGPIETPFTKRRAE